MTAVMANPPGPSLIETLTQEASGNLSFRYAVWQPLQRSTSPKGSTSKKKSVSGTKVVCPARWRRVCFALAFARLARLRFLVSDAMCKPVLRRDRLDFGYDNRFQNPTICSRRLPSSKCRKTKPVRPICYWSKPCCNVFTYTASLFRSCVASE
ncbi:hypothetical protein ALQ65_200319 [Pseudomonas syringae pv. coriandricola]|uniref:Uncharacterized protein n=1 Tax=Pseudomonas syringae pv. coriandricola TaxID=264453 RepID=A0A3M3J8U4_9PSED|nr:hypothetical protein ALQ65_200319 [Pseudomonas syringae pv. coriandricola]